MTSNSEITEFDKVLTMYHGTTIENAITIKSTGFKASDGRGARTEPSRKKGSPLCYGEGNILGPGIYLSRDLRKVKCPTILSIIINFKITFLITYVHNF